SPLVREHGHRDLPALADLSDEMRARHARVLEEDLAELALAGDLPQRSDRHTGRVELDQDERDAAVAVFRVGAGEDEDPVRPRPERRPDFLSVQHELVAFDPRRGLERREVAARAGLAEPLTPDLVGGEHRRQKAAALLLGTVMDERRAEEADAEEVDDR